MRKGLTLIELLITIAIMSILLAIGSAMFTRMVFDQHLITGANQLKLLIGYTKKKALHDNLHTGVLLSQDQFKFIQRLDFYYNYGKARANGYTVEFEKDILEGLVQPGDYIQFEDGLVHRIVRLRIRGENCTAVTLQSPYVYPISWTQRWKILRESYRPVAGEREQLLPQNVTINFALSRGLPSDRTIVFESKGYLVNSNRVILWLTDGESVTLIVIKKSGVIDIVPKADGPNPYLFAEEN